MKKSKKELVKALNERLNKDLGNATLKTRRFGGFSGGYGVHGDTKYNRKSKAAQREKIALKQYL